MRAEKQPGADILRAVKPALRDLIPAWAGGIGLRANAFRQAFFGEDAHPVDAYRLQRVTLAVMHGDDYAGLKYAGQELADAVESIGPTRFAGVLAQAQAQLVPANTDGTPADATPQASVVKVAAAGPLALPGVALPEVGTVLRGVGTVLGGGAAAAAGAAAIVLWPKSLLEPAPGPGDMPPLHRDASEPAAADTVVEARKRDTENDDRPQRSPRPHSRKPDQSPPGEESDTGQPNAGDLKEISDADLAKAAAADGFDSIAKWKVKKLDLSSDVHLKEDKYGNIYSIPRLGKGPAQPTNVRIPK